MNKRQKQLINTYLRKRDIAVNQIIHSLYGSDSFGFMLFIKKLYNSERDWDSDKYPYKHEDNLLDMEELYDGYEDENFMMYRDYELVKREDLPDIGYFHFPYKMFEHKNLSENAIIAFIAGMDMSKHVLHPENKKIKEILDLVELTETIQHILIIVHPQNLRYIISRDIIPSEYIQKISVTEQYYNHSLDILFNEGIIPSEKTMTLAINKNYEHIYTILKHSLNNNIKLSRNILNHIKNKIENYIPTHNKIYYFSLLDKYINNMNNSDE
ncbi:MAG: hypothetical protein ACOC22_00875 [bacterium]